MRLSHVVGDPRWRHRTSLRESESLYLLKNKKMEILEKLNRGISNTAIASEYSIGKSTVTDIQ